MRAPRAVIAALAVLLIAACGDNLPAPSPFSKLPLSGDFPEPTLKAPVHVARDQYGIAHITGDNLADVSFVQGYIMAHDRLPQMDILRRYGSGTLSEMFGALDPSVIDTDLAMRVHRMTYYAQQTWDMLQASTDPDDQQIVQMLQRFSDGVNAYAQDLQAKKWTLDTNILISFDPQRFRAWTPVDSLVLGRFQAFALSYSADGEVLLTQIYQGLRQTFDNATSANPAAYARRGLSRDIFVLAPVGAVSTIPDFPNVGTDTGTRSDGGRPGSQRTSHQPRVAPSGPKRPIVPQALFAAARRFISRDIHDGPFHALGPHAFMRPWAGSNNWAVGPSLAGGKTLLATDQHLQLPNPSIFYPTHITVTGQFDAIGVTFPGIPGIILGSNGDVAWSGTVSEHDVNDVYLENIAPCASGTGNCVVQNGTPQQIQTFTEQIDIGALGTITSHVTATYEVVPNHGPIIPDIQNHQVVPRSTNQAMSIRYTGYAPTFEIRALYKLIHARTVDQGFRALADFTYGSQNWTMIDNSGNIGWTTNAYVPVRDPRAYTWDPVTNPDGLSPFMVLPGDGTAEWQGRLSSRYVPHAIDPPTGFLVTANADPVGATFDNNDLNQTMVDGRPLYVGMTYAAGLREERITQLIEQHAANGPLTLDDMDAIQEDTHSTMGPKLQAAIAAAIAASQAPTGDVATYLAGLSADDQARLARAGQLLASWSGEAPAAVDGTPDAQALTDSAATALFNTWMHFFIERTFKDELAAINIDVWSIDQNFLARTVYRLLSQPATFVQDPATNQPIICDNYSDTGPDDSCTKDILASLVDAMNHLESADGYGTADTTQWRWGKLHNLTITPLFPNKSLDLPEPGQLPTGGFPKSGDQFVINRSDMGWDDLDFHQDADGPAQRFLAEASPGQPIKIKWALPGGTIFDSRDKHYRDLLDNYYIPQKHFDAPYSVSEIVAAGESRMEFHP